MYKSHTKYTEEDLRRYGIEVKQRHGDDIFIHCIFNNCDSDSKGKEAHLSINFKKWGGVYHCHKCKKGGHVRELFDFLRLNIKNYV